MTNATTLIVMALWGLYLAYPLQTLQDWRWVVIGHQVPAYYFLIVFPMSTAALLALASKRAWTRWERLWWLLALICLPGILASGDRAWSIRQWTSWALRGPVPGGILLLNAAGRRDKAIVNWIYPIIAAASLLGLIELFCYDVYYHAWAGGNWFWRGFHPQIAQISEPGNLLYRPPAEMSLSLAPQGTQGNRIPYAATIVAFLPLSLWVLKHKRRFYWAKLAAAAAVCSILLLADVRAVWVASLAGLLLSYAGGLRLRVSDGSKILAIFLVCLGPSLAWPPANQMLRRRLSSFTLSEGSIHERLQVLRTARVLETRWAAGVGFGQFPTACKSYFTGDGPWIETPDNQYLRWAIENGLPGFVLLLGFLGALVRAGWKKVQLMADVEESEFYKALLVGWASLSISFLFFDGFYWGACNMTFWCLLGTFASCLTKRDAPREENNG